MIEDGSFGEHEHGESDMSNGTVNPTPNQTPATVIVTPANHYQIPKEWLPILTLILLIGGIVGERMGWWTADQAKQGEAFILQTVGSDGTTTSQPVMGKKVDGTTVVTVQAKPTPTATPIAVASKATVGDAGPVGSIDWNPIIQQLIPIIANPNNQSAFTNWFTNLINPPKQNPAPIVTPVTPVIPVVPPTPITTDTIQQIIQAELAKLVPSIIQQLTPKPAPIVNPNPPVPIDPSATLKLVLTNEQNQPVTSMTVDQNTMVQCTLMGATGKIVWHITPGGNVSQQPLPNNLGVTFELRAAASWVSIVAVDLGSGQSVSARITANQGAQPPPGPVPVPVVQPVNPVVPNPPNPPKPDGQANVTPAKRHLFLSVVEDPLNRTADTAIVLSAVKVWNGFRTDGNEWRFYDVKSTEEKGKRAVQAAGGILPALVIHDMDSGTLLTAVALPKTIDGVVQVVKIWQYVGL